MKVTFRQIKSFSLGRVVFKGGPREIITETITIINSGPEIYEFAVHLEDWKCDSLGNRVHLPAGSLPYSNSADINLPGTSLKIAPGERKKFMINFTVPVKEQTTNGMLLFTQANGRQSNSGTGTYLGIKLSLEPGVQLFYTPATAENGDLGFWHLKTIPLFATAMKESGSLLNLKIRDRSIKDAYIRFELINKQTGDEIKIPAIPVSIMPQDYQ